MKKEINFTKYKLIPFINNTYTNCHVDKNKKQITVSKKDDIKNIYRYSVLENKTLFLIAKYLPVVIFLFATVTLYEFQNHLLEIVLGFIATSFGLIVNLKYSDKLSFIVTCTWYLLFCYIDDSQNSSMIAKYTLISFLIYQFIFDVNRKYYSIFDSKDNLVSFAFFKRSKI